jgi:hypothetical protein
MKKYYPIPGWDCYGISKCAEIIRLTGGVRGAAVGHVLKQHLHPKRGYLQVRLTNKVAKTFDVHKLMAITFLEKPTKVHQICHNNGIKTDCRLENLRYDTKENNEKDKIFHGTSNRGQKNGMNKHDLKTIVDIKLLLMQGISSAKISQIVNIPSSQIRNIKNGYKWKWVNI